MVNDGSWLLNQFNKIGGSPSDYAGVLTGTVSKVNPLSVTLNGTTADLPSELLTVVQGLSLAVGDGVLILRDHVAEDGSQTFYVIGEI